MSAPPSDRTPSARERLVGTASRLFYAEGIHTVGIDRIIAEAPSTKSTFYRHFASKEDLVLAYLADGDTRTREGLTWLATSGVTPGDGLAAVMSAIGQHVCGAGFRGCQFLNAAAEYPDADSPVRLAVAEHRAWFLDLLTERLRACGLPEHDAQDGARHLVMLRDGAMAAGYLHDPAQAAETLRRATSAVVDPLALRQMAR